MDDELLKLECLKLSPDGEGRIQAAQRLFDFIKGRNQTDLVGGGKARVVGKDGDHPFKDYKPE